MNGTCNHFILKLISAVRNFNGLINNTINVMEFLIVYSSNRYITCLNN